MNMIQKFGLFLLVLGICIFVLLLGMNNYNLQIGNIYAKTDYHKKAIFEEAGKANMLKKDYSSNFKFIRDYRSIFKAAQAKLASNQIPEGVEEWDYRLGDWEFSDYVLETVKASSSSVIKTNWFMMFFLTIGISIIGGLLYIIPLFKNLPGIKNDHIYHNSLTRGLKLTPRSFFLVVTILGVLIYGIQYMGLAVLLPLLTAVVIAIIIYLVMYKDGQKQLNPPKSASPNFTGWLGVITGSLLILFYVLLYWAPEYITAWIDLVNPISRFISGNDASRWFLYGFLYTIIVIVMGIRMLAKYRHNTYQQIRTGSVMFFQTGFAFLIPELMARLNAPYFDFKNIWPLDYTFFFDYRLNELLSGGGIGLFMLVWGLILIFIGVPLMTYFFGKRWYCSWVCGCGGLAETMGDPFRQLSDKSLRAWKYERYIIHGVLVFAVLMTIMVLYTFFTGSSNIIFLDSNTIRQWYGFLIGSAFAGVVGTGFYPLMGNRTWCRFGCPLAAYLGLVQKFKSRFRITVNGGQCISCGNCSTYCEMGIDVRWYAQRGQDIVRSSCVGCGICSAVCPRGVLRLENSSLDVNMRSAELRTLHIAPNEVKLIES